MYVGMVFSTFYSVVFVWINLWTIYTNLHKNSFMHDFHRDLCKNSFDIDLHRNLHKNDFYPHLIQ